MRLKTGRKQRANFDKCPFGTGGKPDNGFWRIGERIA
jgi:hypothetical protein